MFRYLNIKLNNISTGRYSGGNPLHFVTPAYSPQVYAGYSSVWVRFPISVKRLHISQLGAYLH